MKFIVTLLLAFFPIALNFVVAYVSWNFLAPVFGLPPLSWIHCLALIALISAVRGQAFSLDAKYR